MTSDEINYSWFQQDGATAHTSGRSIDLLKEFFGDRIISEDLWPPCSPDLNPADFFIKTRKTRVFPGFFSLVPETRVLKFCPELETLISDEQISELFV